MTIQTLLKIGVLTTLQTLHMDNHQHTFEAAEKPDKDEYRVNTQRTFILAFLKYYLLKLIECKTG